MASAVQPEDSLLEERQIANKLERFDSRYFRPLNLPPLRLDDYEADLSPGIRFSEFSSLLTPDIPQLERLEYYIEMVRVQIERLTLQP